MGCIVGLIVKLLYIYRSFRSSGQPISPRGLTAPE